MSSVLDHWHVPGVHAPPAPKTGMWPQAITLRKSSVLYVSTLPFGRCLLKGPGDARYLVKNRGAADARLTVDHAGD
jgi:hypothetical protein